MPETFAKYPDVDEVRGVAAQRVQTYQIDRQTSEQRTTKKFAADGYFAKVSACLKSFSDRHGLIFFHLNASTLAVVQIIEHPAAVDFAQAADAYPRVAAEQGKQFGNVIVGL